MNFNKTSPIIIVAAGRSGSKMLRSILNSTDNMNCFPREINYIWRHGNANFPTDELKSIHARPEVAHYINKCFERFGRTKENKRVIEKTCANSLRVEFVQEIFPEAFFIHLIRDGRAVVESSMRRWKAPLEIPYLLEKLRWVPITDIPYYMVRYLKYRITPSNEKVQSSWGPRFSGIDQIVKKIKLIEVCALQWKTCVNSAESALKKIEDKNKITIRYEDLVNESVKVSGQIFKKLQIKFSSCSQKYVEKEIHRRNLNKWRQVLSVKDIKILNEIIGSDLIRFGYGI